MEIAVLGALIVALLVVYFKVSNRILSAPDDPRPNVPNLRLEEERGIRMSYIAEKGRNTYALTDFHGVGVDLHFQDGPIKEHGINGTTNEEVIELLIERINSLNQPPFNCRENSLAITKLEEALLWLKRRTEKRIERGVEGTAVP